MREIPREKKGEIAQYYLMGSSYADIEKQTGVSHGSIANIVEELENGKLTIPGTPFDQVNDLRQLSLDLKKKGLDASQALLGVSVFERLKGLGVGPADVGRWSELMKALAPADFPVKDLFESAVRLHKLEETVGKPFEDLTEEYSSLEGKREKLRKEIDSLNKRKEKLTAQVEPLTSQTQALEDTKQKLQSILKIQETKVEEVKTKVIERGREMAQLSEEVKDLKAKRKKLSSEVDGKEESLKRLQDIGFSDEDLLRLQNRLENMGRKDGTDSNKVKADFFATLCFFDDLRDLQKVAKKEAETINKLRNKKSLLAGKIAGLESRKAVLQGEVHESASLAAQEIRDELAEAASLIREETEAMRAEMKHVLKDALVAGTAIGEMRAMQKRGEESLQELEGFLNEVKKRVEGK